MSEREAVERELSALRERIGQLETKLSAPPEHWQASDFYATYYATTGFFLGLFAAATSLLFNIVGASFVGKHPLELIKVYLTFPLKDAPLTGQMDSGVTLAMGCCLYLATGMLLGIPFQLVLTRFAGERSTLGWRLLVATIMGIALWLINFYGILNWLQPLLFGGNWIVELIPWWVAALTHLVFAWTMAIIFPLGLYKPYRPEVDLQ
ncbi:MAG: hypothetical protein U0795_15215 [Pirellulales bacterium]